MRVFKFGGASVKDANAIQNVAEIILSYIEVNNPILTVVSAMGKTTNKLEQIAKAVHDKDQNSSSLLHQLIAEHLEIVDGLSMEESSQLKIQIQQVNERLENFIQSNQSSNYNYIYDQVVSSGEILSTNILFHYLISRGMKARLIDARYLIKTDSNYTDANILWNETETSIQKEMKELNEDVVITQGFIGANSEMLYTTLGREGSDYTAAILASAMKTKELTIWKDVDGVYTADPKKFPEATIVPRLSYKEAVEMTFYGAQIIHPKTIKPIQNSSCILKVKSFLNRNAIGTEIGNFESVAYQPSIVLKEHQVLYSFSVKDFSFLNESNLGKIIATFGKYSLRINLMQNTAIEFLVVTDDKLGKNEQIIEDLNRDFDIKMDTHLKLMTIRHYSEDLLEKQRQNSAVLVTQKSKFTIQYLMKE